MRDFLSNCTICFIETIQNDRIKSLNSCLVGLFLGSKKPNLKKKLGTKSRGRGLIQLDSTSNPKSEPSLTYIRKNIVKGCEQSYYILTGVKIGRKTHCQCSSSLDSERTKFETKQHWRTISPYIDGSRAVFV